MRPGDENGPSAALGSSFFLRRGNHHASEEPRRPPCIWTVLIARRSPRRGFPHGHRQSLDGWGGRGANVGRGCYIHADLRHGMSIRRRPGTRADFCAPRTYRRDDSFDFSGLRDHSTLSTHLDSSSDTFSVLQPEPSVRDPLTSAPLMPRVSATERPAVAAVGTAPPGENRLR